MKLGFAINYASEGLTTALVCNKGQWTNKVIDVREYLKMFSGLAIQSQSHQESTGNKLTFLSFDESGCLLTIAKAISGRWGDFLACWIYIPNSVVIDGEQVVGICRFASGVIDESNIKSREEEIQEFFSQSYPDKDKCITNIPSSGDKFGIRYIDEVPLADLLGDNRYQQYYSAYKAIFLISHSGEVKPIVRLFENLTNQPMQTYSIVEAPTIEDLSILGENSQIYFNTGERFDKDLRVLENKKLQLIAKRPGFVDIPLTPISVTEWNKKNLFTQALNWKIRLTNSIFKVRNSEGKILSDFQVKVNGHLISNGLNISENEARNITYTVTAPGYEEFSGYADLSKGVRNIEIKLHRQVRIETHNIILRNNSIAEITLKGREMNFSMDRFPLKGYSYNDGRRAFCLDWWFVLKQRLIGILYAIIIAICFVLYFTFDAWCDNHVFGGAFPWIHEKPKTEVILNTDTIDSDSEFSYNDSLAIKYLDNNNVWSKDSLESFDLTKNLYDDMNCFLFNGFAEKYSIIIKVSKKMQDVSRAMNLSLKDKIDPMRGKEGNGSKYNPDSDTKIDVSRYIDWITKSHESSSENYDVPIVESGSERESTSKQSNGIKKNRKSVQKSNQKLKSTTGPKIGSNRGAVEESKDEKDQ